MSSESLPLSACLICAVMKKDCDESKPICTQCAGKSNECVFEWALDNANVYTSLSDVIDYTGHIKLFSPFSNRVGGRYGTTYRAELGNGEAVAVKVLFRQRTANSPAATLSTLQAARAWRNLAHPNIVPFLGIANLSVICMESFPQVALISPWMQGGNIMEFIENNLHIDRFALLADVARGVAHLHAQTPPIIHGGLRGSNVLIDIGGESPQAVLRDFDHARRAQHYGWNYQPYDKAGPRLAARWTAFERMAPGRFGIEDWDATHTISSDVFELMRLFLEVLSGKPPFIDIKSDYQVEDKVRSCHNPGRPHGSDMLITDGMWELMQRAWSTTISERPALHEVLESLKI